MAVFLLPCKILNPTVFVFFILTFKWVNKACRRVFISEHYFSYCHFTVFLLQRQILYLKENETKE